MVIAAFSCAVVLFFFQIVKHTMTHFISANPFRTHVQAVHTSHTVCMFNVNCKLHLYCILQLLE